MIEKENFPKTKVCTQCKCELPLEYFQIDNRNKIDGRQSRCRDCRHADYMKNATSIIAKVKKWTDTHTQEVKERKRTYSRKNRDAISFAKLLYEEENTIRVLTQEKEHHEKERAIATNWTPELRKEAFISQNNKCCICGGEANSGKSLCCDHNHRNGVIRGLLCDKCNRGLGLFQDNPELLLKASKYLNFYNQYGTTDKYIKFSEDVE